MLAISGYIDEDEVRSLKEFGFDDYLKKPFSVNDLSERVTKLFEMPVAKIARPRRVHAGKG